ncbi:4'-phosphopantetheinyl transferase family protein [Paraburkholderia sp. BCC1885]|uniref:4'-phosphopantetheinyl transferase family protein n=1 Tax=Paraburkholderia sp. BCC1885 TaxID=2562669 RepID=UPI001183B4EF|nr:4'-phosphopantetheinyl transferase superfamily protein [Paraburkholderia sp. BCC1885]
MQRFSLVPVSHDGPSDVQVWRVDIAFDTTLESPAFSALASDEHARARVFRRPEDALRFATVRAALRQLLADALGIEPKAVQLASDAMGRPCLAAMAGMPDCARELEPNPLDFNVSHSGARGLIALSRRRRVGVDIERYDAQLDWRALTSMTLSESEAVWLEQRDAGECLYCFYDAWVAKEALLKTTGVGVVRGLQRLTVLPREGSRVTLRAEVPDEARNLSASWLAAPVGYAACVAWETSPVPHAPERRALS